MWQAGIGKRYINPNEPIHLDGWGGGKRENPSEGISGDIYIKALALKDDAGHIGVLVTSDLMAIGRTMSERVAAKVCADHKLDRSQFVWNMSHSHSAPIVQDSLPLYWALSDEAYAVIDRWSAQMEQSLHDAVADALADLKPAALKFEQGLAGIAVNRRRSRLGGRKLTTQTDPDVPVMTISEPNGALRGILFGYACHTTSVNDMKANGDYAGWAQMELEKSHPGVTALFVGGCGADANPLPRLRGDLWKSYGHILAEAVETVLEGNMMDVSGPLNTGFVTATLELQSPKPRDYYVAQLQNPEHSTAVRSAQYQLDKIDRGEPQAVEAPFPIHVWRLGNDLTFIGLTGETVCDYALRFKHAYGVDNTWVAGYCNELIAYVPSRRVLEEGGYEGRTGMAEYGHCAPFRSTVEEIIASNVDELVRATGGDPVGDRHVVDH